MPPIGGELWRQPGTALGQAFDGPPASSTPLRAVGLVNPGFVGDEPAEKGLEGGPAVFHGSGSSVFPARNGRVRSVPEADVAFVAAKHETGGSLRSGPRDYGTMEFHPAVFPRHRVAAGAGEAWGRGPGQAEPHQ